MMWLVELFVALEKYQFTLKRVFYRREKINRKLRNHYHSCFVLYRTFLAVSPRLNNNCNNENEVTGIRSRNEMVIPICIQAGTFVGRSLAFSGST
jgi:hypothetical protein